MASGSELRSGGAIGRRVLLFSALTILVAMLSAGMALTLMFERNVLHRVGQELEQRWTELARNFVVKPDGSPAIGGNLGDPRYAAPYGGSYWQVSRDGEAVLRSRSLWDFSVLRDGPAAGKAAPFESAGPEDSTLYAFADSVTLTVAGAPRRYELLVALDHAEIDELRHSFMRDAGPVLAAFAAILIAGAGLTWRFGLLPLRHLRRALGAVRDGTQARLAGAMPEEVLPLASDLNAMLARHDEMVARARDRAGALAHGLKTPLTILRNELETLEKKGDRARAAAMREQLDAIAAHVERELARARMHASGSVMGGSTAIRPVTERLVTLMRRMDLEDALSWQVEIAEDSFARMEADDFAEVLGNLLDNARKWAKSRVVIREETMAGRHMLSVRDDGPGVPPVVKAVMRERGVHFGKAQDQSTGLGLAIAVETLAAYGRTLDISDSAGGCEMRFALA
jgi:signal transduction histidine kinase